MSILTAQRHAAPRRVRVPYAREIVAVACVAAALGYVVHHVPPLREHPSVGVAVALLAAAGAAVGLSALGRGHREYQLPTVLVPPPGGAEIRRLDRDELAFCAALHCDSLPHGFFVKLGTRFLRAYYATFLDSPHAVALVATVSGQPVGVLVGVLRPRAHARWLMGHRGPALALRGALAMAMHPVAALHFLRTRLRRYARAWRRHRAADPRLPGGRDAGAAVLSHVAVVPGARGTAVGRRLVRAFEAEAVRYGATRAYLTTLEGPQGAGSFYARLGWSRARSHLTPDGVRMEEWTRGLDEGGHS
jgi:GNAT superfamily N-acetyltransferase